MGKPGLTDKRSAFFKMIRRGKECLTDKKTEMIEISVEEQVALARETWRLRKKYIRRAKLSVIAK